ncbi:MAG: sugar ABC transporter permease [Bacilli bacterium]|nr:sugar ABC transporter permease [Acholeplasmataceae bacterium]MDY2903250.1 sugar ABC transporter permease [Bacilli bacterium]
MKKIKEFFNKIFSAIGNFFRFLGRKIVTFFRWLNDTTAVKKIKYGLGYVPNLIAGRLKNQTRKKIWGMIFLVPIVIGFVYFFLLPFIFTIIYSFSYVENGDGLRDLEFVGFDNYIYAFKIAQARNADYTYMSFGEWIVEGVIDMVTDIPIILIFSMIMAVVLNSKFKGRAVVRAIFFIPVIFNSQAIDTATAAYATLANTTNGATKDLFEQMFSFKDFMLEAKMPAKIVTFLGNASTKIYDIISYSGIQILIFLSAIQSVPRHLYEAAKMEGATQYEMFWKITFPMVSPMLLAAAVYTVVDSFLRSPVLKILDIYSSTTKESANLAEYGIGLLLPDGTLQLTDFGINAAMSMIFTLIVVLIMGIIVGILSKVVFYYDE